VLRPGGLYLAEHWNPLQMQLDGLGTWTGKSYRIVRPQSRSRPVSLAASGDAVLENPTMCWHYIHTLEDLVGGLGSAGFTIVTFDEPTRGDPDAPPGSAEHLAAFVPPFFTILAQLDPPPSSSPHGHS
jgi:hypothetical protein